LRLALKATAGSGIGQLVGKELHRDTPVQLRVEGLVYNAHASFTDVTLNYVRADF
jgi:hypothetical protein